MHAVNATGWFAQLLADHQAPCVSIYFPAQRAAPPADQNQARFRDLLDKAQQQLREKYPDRFGKSVLRKLHTIPAEQIGPGPHDGIAVFASPDYLQVIDLQRGVDDLVVVSDTFHVKPLIRTMQHGDRYEILCFSPNRIRIFEGNAHSITQLPLRNVPACIFEAHQVPVAGQSIGQAAPMKMEQFIRLVDRAVWEDHSRTSHLPLVVAADSKHLAEFLGATKNQYVIEQGMALQPDHIDDARLHTEAWKMIEPRCRAELNRLGDQFRSAKARQKGSDELTQVAEAAAVGRVDTLIVDATVHIPGVVDRRSGMIEQDMLLDARAEDLLDNLAEMVLKRDGQVYVLPHEMMPTDAGVAAMYRY